MKPSYLRLWETGVLPERTNRVRDLLVPCRLCPRQCRVDRLSGQTGFCGQGARARVAKALPHFGEEPPLTGERGAGTVFFSGCALRCLYCQNFQISQEGLGEEVSAEVLADTFLDLQRQGCHNLDLVSPTPHWPFIFEALELAIPRGLSLPVVYNTHGYDSEQALECLRDRVDIYLPDMKYANNEIARELSGVEEYRQANRSALRAMFAQVGHLVEDPDSGLARRGLLVRILVLPGRLEGAKASLVYLKSRFSTELAVSLMAQYAPLHMALSRPPLDRTLEAREYQEAVDSALELGFRRVWVQDLRAALTGVPDFSAETPFVF